MNKLSVSDFEYDEEFETFRAFLSNIKKEIKIKEGFILHGTRFYYDSVVLLDGKIVGLSFLGDNGKTAIIYNG